MLCVCSATYAMRMLTYAMRMMTQAIEENAATCAMHMPMRRMLCVCYVTYAMRMLCVCYAYADGCYAYADTGD